MLKVATNFAPNVQTARPIHSLLTLKIPEHVYALCNSPKSAGPEESIRWCDAKNIGAEKHGSHNSDKRQQ
jgi:hypothetical protein